MISEFVDAYMNRQEELRSKFKEKHPENYLEIVKNVVGLLPKIGYNQPDPERIHEIDDGSYQGTLVYVIGCDDYQPSVYWYVKVSYGSCSGCDALEGIRHYDDAPPDEEQIKDYMTLALHIVQGLKQMDDDMVYE